ncbi:ribosomal protein L11 methyltransferase [Alphaproteobacteria bacterium]|nr:ribosomal protein L11 methyltransferase [Alphaproteobacteria bacterium]
MNEDIYKYVVGNFSIKDAFDVMDIFFDSGYLSVSTMEERDHWLVEILDNKPIDDASVVSLLKNYKYSVVKSEKVADTDWLKKCFENFKPIQVGNFYIFGPHLRNKPVPLDKIGIEIAAATAFGTGEHPTTNRCLLGCQTFFDEKKHKTAIDIGTGSGVLSIALAKLGCRCVTACDNDPESVRVSRENTVINKVAHRVDVFQNESCEFSAKNYNFIVANILSEPLISMAEHVEKCLTKNGIAILSGFSSQDKSVKNKYISLGLTLKYEYDFREWVTIVLEKSN